MSEAKLIVGLGNPGKEYAWTRHNLGFLVVRRLAEKFKIDFGLSSLKDGWTAEGRVGKMPFCLFLPRVYMNQSGIAVQEIIQKENRPLKNMLVVCDDINLPFGQLRLRPRGTDGGHNGLRSVIEHLGTEGFARLRLGVDPPQQSQDAADYVLEGFDKQQKRKLDDFINEAMECCLMWLDGGINKAMELFNRRKDNGKQ